MTDRPVTTPPRRRQNRIALLVVAALIAVACIAAAVVVVSTGGPSRAHRTNTPAEQSVRYDAIRRLLAARSAAIVGHDRAAFMATVDPRHTAFRRAQSRMFANLAAVHFASWAYSMASSPRHPPRDAGHYRDPVWAPSYFALRYRLAHFDRQPTNLRQYPTFVRRGRRWYLGSLNDFAGQGLVSATDIWDYGPVSAVRRADVLVLGSPSQRATMLDVASDIEAAIPQVTSVWGSGWSQRAVVLVPRTVHDMALIDDDHEDLSQVAALTSAEVMTAAGHPSPVGGRITINPANWPKLSALGAQVVLRHELTHVATASSSGAQTPTWLVEGFADYVGFKFSGVSVAAGAAELQAKVRAGQVPTRLPVNRDFRGSGGQVAVAYEAAWFACRTIARLFGQPALVRFYRQVGTSTRPSLLAVRTALRDVLHLTVARFIALWSADLRAELA